MRGPDPSIESLVVSALPGDDRQLLQRGAVLRYITGPLAELVTDSPRDAERLIDHPVVRGGGQGSGDGLWTIAEPLRKALLAGWAGADDIRARVGASTGLEALYARLAAPATRAEALFELDEQVSVALKEGDMPRAHDLLRLLEEWPVTEADEAAELGDRLTPRLRRHTRALRDREATATYLERGFDRPVWTLLLTDSAPWILQLHGPGGRGKTMFVKNLLGRRCPEQDIPVARIDFDHVTRLGLATTEPWRLLLAIAEQLDPQLPGAPFQYLLATYRTVESVTQPEALPRVPPLSAGGSGILGDQHTVDAAAEVPVKFRSRLARAVGAGHVVIALDTVENVLHADGADLAPVLAAFGEVFDGDGGPADDRVPGLRLVISGRYDITGVRPAAAGPDRVRAPGVRERWSGETTPLVSLGGTEAVLGREMATLEVPGFSRDEARRFLTERDGMRDRPEIVEAIVARIHDNPMKLALFAEYVANHPGVTVETIGSFERIDLFYLVDRVVDRIADGPVQWLLRWGALLPILSRTAAEQVVWPALVAFAGTGTGGGYDDTSRDGLPPPPAEVVRWPVPRPEHLGAPGAFDRAWETLLEYTAHASWVSRVDGLPDAVVFHPEVREPVRRLLRTAGHPAYDDIHRRSFAYWSGVAASAPGATRTAALRAVLFHAYQPWDGPDGDRLFAELLRRSVDSRDERTALAREVLELAGEDGAGGPSDEARSLAHLELAEAAVDLANRHGTAVNEAALSYHLGQAGTAATGRTAFLLAVLAEASGHPDEGWNRLGIALDRAPDRPTLDLMASWADGRTPSLAGLAAAARLAEETGAAAAVRALTRGLLAAERWTEAYEAVPRADSASLRAETLIALGEAGAVLADTAAPGLWRARARLLRYEPSAALAEPSAGLLVAGQAYAQLGHQERALDAFSRAASSPDSATAVRAALAIARYQARTGHPETAASHLLRLRGFADPIVALRAAALEARLLARRDEALSRGRFTEARRAADAQRTLPPSVEVELAVTRLAVRGVSEERLRRLEVALAAVHGPGPRLLALDGLAEVPDPPWVGRTDAGERLTELTSLDAPEPAAALLLARAELARVLGDRTGALTLLDEVAGRDDPDHAIGRAVVEAIARIRGGATRTATPAAQAPAVPADETRAAIAVSLHTETPEGRIRIERPGTTTEIPPGLVAGGHRELGRAAAQLLERFGSALVPAGDQGLESGRLRPLDLVLEDADVARWPWEAAASPYPSELLRRHFTGPGTAELVPSPSVLIAVFGPGRSMERAVNVLGSAYRPRATVREIQVDDREQADFGTAGDVAVVHLVANPVQRRGLPALQLGGELLTAESLVLLLARDEPRLLILDVALSDQDYDAAEQLMVANEFCWHLVRGTPYLDVICGSFGLGRDGRLGRLIDRLADGDPLSAVAAELQSGRPRWQDAVAVSTDHPGRRYLLGGPR